MYLRTLFSNSKSRSLILGSCRNRGDENIMHNDSVEQYSDILATNSVKSLGRTDLILRNMVGRVVLQWLFWKLGVAPKPPATSSFRNARVHHHHVAKSRIKEHGPRSRYLALCSVLPRVQVLVVTTGFHHTTIGDDSAFADLPSHSASAPRRVLTKHEPGECDDVDLGVSAKIETRMLMEICQTFRTASHLNMSTTHACIGQQHMDYVTSPRL